MPLKTHIAIALVMLTLITGAGPALARHKHKPAANEICFNAALSAEDQSACKKQMSAQTTADGRAAVHKAFKRKVTEAQAAAEAPGK